MQIGRDIFHVSIMQAGRELCDCYNYCKLLFCWGAQLGSLISNLYQ
jgi:hypothetical protein